MSVSVSVSVTVSHNTAPSIKSQADSDSCVDAGFDACCDSNCSVGNCYCDAACHFFKDCCHDIQQTCPRSLITCCFSLLLLPQPPPPPPPPLSLQVLGSVCQSILLVMESLNQIQNSLQLAYPQTMSWCPLRKRLQLLSYLKVRF